MLISEFTDRTGFKPTEEYYHAVIEPEYEISDLDKDVWCSQWEKNGGIQKAYDEMHKTAVMKQVKIKSLETQLRELNKSLDSLINDREARVEERLNLVYFLIEQSAKLSASDLREKAIEMIGERDFIKYKLEHGIALCGADSQYLLYNLKNK